MTIKIGERGYTKTDGPSQRINLSFLEKYPFSWEMANLPSGNKVQVKKYFVVFKAWRGRPIQNSYGNKAVIDWRGEPVFAELAVLRLFQENGWNGVWVDSYHRKFRVGLPDVVDPIQLSPDKQHLIDSIKEETGISGGCWDVLVWKSSRVLFVELKRQGKDKLQDSQCKWLETSIGAGLTPSNFAIIEWDLADELART